MTAIVALASASIAAPVLVKSDRIPSIGGGKDPAAVQTTEDLVAGEFTFQMPSDWGRLGASSLAEGDPDAAAAGTVVAAVCPAGRHGSTCADGVRVAFVNYRGGEGRTLPLVSSFGTQLDEQLPARIPSMQKVESETMPTADGTRFLRYEFTYVQGRPGVQQTEVLGAYRNTDGSGVVAVATGPKEAFEDVAADVDAFLASAAQSAKSA